MPAWQDCGVALVDQADDTEALLIIHIRIHLLHSTVKHSKPEALEGTVQQCTSSVLRSLCNWDITEPAPRILHHEDALSLGLQDTMFLALGYMPCFQACCHASFPCSVADIKKSSISLQDGRHMPHSSISRPSQFGMTCRAHHSLRQVTCFPVSADERPAEEFSMP